MTRVGISMGFRVRLYKTRPKTTEFNTEAIEHETEGLWKPIEVEFKTTNFGLSLLKEKVLA